MKKDWIVVGVTVCAATLAGVSLGIFIQQKTFETKVRNISRAVLTKENLDRPLAERFFDLHRKRTQVLRRILKKLELTPEQQEKVKEILKEKQEDTRLVLKGFHHKLTEIKKDTQQRINEILTPQQQEKLKRQISK